MKVYLVNVYHHNGEHASIFDAVFLSRERAEEYVDQHLTKFVVLVKEMRTAD